MNTAALRLATRHGNARTWFQPFRHLVTVVSDRCDITVAIQDNRRFMDHTIHLRTRHARNVAKAHIRKLGGAA